VYHREKKKGGVGADFVPRERRKKGRERGDIGGEKEAQKKASLPEEPTERGGKPDSDSIDPSEKKARTTRDRVLPGSREKRKRTLLLCPKSGGMRKRKPSRKREKKGKHALTTRHRKGGERANERKKKEDVRFFSIPPARKKGEADTPATLRPGLY